MTRTLALAALVLLSACGKKDAPAESSGDAAAGTATANVPDDANSKEFAKMLLATPVHNFSPADAGSVKFEYVTLTFKPDNTWLAVSKMASGDEFIDCKESGTWTMDPAERPNSAIMEWKLVETTCPGRTTENIMRTQVTFKDGKPDILFR